MVEKFVYPNHPVRSIITGASECGKSVFLTILILNIISDYKKTYIYSPSVHQDFYQKLIEFFTNYISIQIIPKIIEEDIDVVLEETVNNTDFEKSDTEIEIYERIEEIKVPQEYDGGIFILDDLYEKEMNDPSVGAMFKRSRHNNLSIYIFSQDYYELPKRNVRANGNIYHTFKPNNFRDVQKLYQDKASMDMRLNEFKYLTSICWDKKYQTSMKKK